MKVGILTWYEVLNYGSVFQAYALQEQIKLMGNNAVILKHTRAVPDYYGNKFDGKSILDVAKWIRRQTPNCIKNRKATRKKCELFDAFRNQYLKIDKNCSETDSDVVVIGSDQIFDINGMYYSFQFGKEVSCTNICTYAPSFGETTYDMLKSSDKFEEICEAIKNLNVVNARDQNTKCILETILDKEIPTVLDPTLMYSFEKEKKIWNKRLIKEKYCLIYTWGGYSTSLEFAKCCKQFAKENDLILVSVGERRPWCDLQFASASPIEFFELFMHADMVLTNMFHGTCFSILMERPFYSFVMPHNENKLGGLLKYLNLETQIISSLDEFPDEIPKMNYDKIKNDLLIKREWSVGCLKDGLDKVRK